MNNLFSKYQRALVTIFFLWLLLVIIKKFGFSFGVHLSVFFRIFLFLFVIWSVWLAKIRWLEISAIIKKIWENIKNEFVTETKEIQKEVHESLPCFLVGKTGTILSFFIAILFSFFILPWRLVKKIFKKYILNQISLLVLVSLGIFMDIFIFKFTSNLLILPLVGLWILSVKHYKFKSKVSITGALIFLIICPFLLILNWDTVAEKSAVWAYIFLVIGVWQLFFEFFKTGENDREKNKITI
jgi:hypothetical protein